MTTIKNQAHPLWSEPDCIRFSCHVSPELLVTSAVKSPLVRRKVRPLANSRNLPICVCASRKFDKKNGKICKIHEEKHKIDVKENEKSGEMRGFATPKQGMRDPKQGMRSQKQGIWALPKRAHPLWMHFAKPNQIHN